jgi:hypothetical protein
VSSLNRRLFFRWGPEGLFPGLLNERTLFGLLGRSNFVFPPPRFARVVDKNEPR